MLRVPLHEPQLEVGLWRVCAWKVAFVPRPRGVARQRQARRERVLGGAAVEPPVRPLRPKPIYPGSPIEARPLARTSVPRFVLPF